jgi:hypothetical protein
MTLTDQIRLLEKPILPIDQMNADQTAHNYKQAYNAAVADVVDLIDKLPAATGQQLDFGGDYVLRSNR